MNNEILYQSDKCFLINNDNELIINYNNNTYYLDSYPYEPCLYVKLNNKMVVIIHNSFNTFEIIDVARNKNKIRAITGKEYGIEEICELLVCAIDSKVFDIDISYLEKQLAHEILVKNKNDNIIENKSKLELYLNEINNNIRELTEDVFYKEYKKYAECVLDYCIINSDLNYNGEELHKKVVIFAMLKWAKKLKDEYDIDITLNSENMKASRLDAKSFFEISAEGKEKNKQYWYLFLNPPYGCNYKIKDFEYINSILFPKGYDNLEIFEWSTDWSNYFDEGLEWWGARCTSIYDKNMNRFVVIGASATD